ncbi:MAG: RuBisCO large subunit C-terminal-like domain-containing protein [Anaerolineae bacterium]|nr:RuBisCO large subunit C-terminal-like domain-containing protein [Anaerolineae bacterium]
MTIPLPENSPFRKFYAESYNINPDDYITLEYYFETDENPYEIAAHLCQEQSTAQWKRVDVDEDFREQFASKIISVERNTHSELFVDEENPGEEQESLKGWWVKIAYPHHNFGARIPNLMTALCGEGAFHSHGMKTIKLMDVHFPDSYLAQFEGPRFGTEGIREMLGVYDRPLTLGVIKPNIGLPSEPFAELGYKAWLGGLDIAKDDELLCDTPANPTEKRMTLLGNYRLKAEKETGKKKMYLANITDEVDRMFELYEMAQLKHVNAVMINGLTTGLSIVRVLGKKGQIPLFSHFDFIAPFTQKRRFGVHLRVVAKLQRLAGYDAQIYQGLGERMHTSVMDVLTSYQACVEPMGHLRPSLPVPGGSQWAGSFKTMFELFNSKDFAIVPGRAVFSHPMGPGAGAAALLQAWDALQKGVSIDEYAKTHVELQQAILANK